MRFEGCSVIAEADESVVLTELEPSVDGSQGPVSQSLTRLSDTALVDSENRSRWRFVETTPTRSASWAVLDETRFSPGRGPSRSTVAPLLGTPALDRCITRGKCAGLGTRRVPDWLADAAEREAPVAEQALTSSFLVWDGVAMEGTNDILA